MSIGQRLQSTRAQKNLTLEEASKMTKIQGRILQALEEDRISEILDPAYAKIFLKRYASFLGLDGLALVEEYSTQQGPLPERPLFLETDATKGKSLPWKQVLIPAGAGILGLVGISFLGFLTLDFVGKIRQPSQGASSKAAFEAQRQRPRGASESLPKWLVPNSQPLKLTVRVKSDVWMQVKSDGSVIFQNVLARGAQESWTAQKELELWTGNAGAMELTLNGKPLGSPGTGVKKGIRVTHAGLAVPD